MFDKYTLFINRGEGVKYYMSFDTVAELKNAVSYNLTQGEIKSGVLDGSPLSIQNGRGMDMLRTAGRIFRSALILLSFPKQRVCSDTLLQTNFNWALSLEGGKSSGENEGNRVFSN